MGNGDGFFYVILQGETLSSIAKRFALKNWRVIYDHEKNEEFRNLRPNPNLIYPGDLIWVPAAKANKGAGKSGKAATFVGKVTDVTILSLEFLSDHGLMKINEKDWTKKGDTVPSPEWKGRRTYPVSHNCSSPLRVKAAFQIRSKAKEPIDVIMAGAGSGDWNSFQTKTELKPKSLDLELESAVPVPNMVGAFEVPQIVWKAMGADSDYAAGRSGPHTIYTTLSTPIDEGKPEDGVTSRRMEAAIRWYVDTGDAVEILDIIEAWFNRFEGYILSFDHLPPRQQKYLDKHKDVKKRLMKAGFASYMKDDQGGAWPLAEFEKFGGECQAIVRFIRGIKNQIGLPGTAEVRYVNADASDHLTPIIRDHGTGVAGPDKDKVYALVDGKVEAGKVYTDADVGWNNYEAYMKFTVDFGGGEARVAWFGGGVGKLGEADANNPDEVAALEETLILVFWGLAEYERAYVGGGTRRKVTRVWEYPHHAE